MWIPTKRQLPMLREELLGASSEVSVVSPVVRVPGEV